MQSPRVKLEHFRKLLKHVETWPVSSPVLAHDKSVRPVQVFSDRFSPCLSRFISVQGKPILFFSLLDSDAAQSCPLPGLPRQVK
jgi:hypothetical protein